MLTTVEWAASLGISVASTPPVVPDYHVPPARSSIEIAKRALIIHGVAAATAGVAPERIVDWLQNESLWNAVSPKEMQFLNGEYEGDLVKFQWHIEAEWTLLWIIGFVESLGLPTACCDSRRLIDQIIPELGASVTDFLEAAKLRSSGALLSEDDRTYNLWCRWHQARKNGEPLPGDLNEQVLYERRYAFEWLDGHQSWDSVTCDT